LDIEGLYITVTSTPQGEKPSVKGKAKARSEGTEILNGAKLRLKAGHRYALVGRNGSGKSTLLRAIDEKLIPGIPEQTRISILQQTNAKDANTDIMAVEATPDGAEASQGRSVLEEVIEKATARFEVEQEIRGENLMRLLQSYTNPFSSVVEWCQLNGFVRLSPSAPTSAPRSVSERIVPKG
jgi:ATPase subunit of ABC transporter with duplicated ATPase domains